MTLVEDRPLVELAPEPELPPRALLSRVAPLLVIAALLGLIGSAGTWAAFSASTDNAATFATGSLVLANTVTGGTGTCESDDDAGLATNASTCDQLFAISTQRPGQVVSETLTLQNVGTVDAAALKVFASGCTSEATGTFSGTGSLCSTLRLSIQEYGDSGFTSPSACIYGGGTATTCDFDNAAKTIDGLPDTWDTALLLGTLPATETRYLRVAVKLDSSAGNSLQGQQASFSLTWRMEQ